MIVRKPSNSLRKRFSGAGGQPARAVSLADALRANWFVAVLALALFLLAY